MIPYYELSRSGLDREDALMTIYCCTVHIPVCIGLSLFTFWSSKVSGHPNLLSSFINYFPYYKIVCVLQIL